MVRPLLPLNALRAFESASRHLNFSRTADELSVTPGAVSQQIRLLEKALEVDLFIRKHNALELTAAGRDLFGADRADRTLELADQPACVRPEHGGRILRNAGGGGQELLNRHGAGGAGEKRQRQDAGCDRSGLHLVPSKAPSGCA